jgi:transcriptional regulator with XRE-family HTH domain
MSDEVFSRSSNAMRISKSIQLKRQELGLNQEECAEFIGVEPHLYSEYELGLSFPTLPDVEALGYYFDTLPECFWTEINSVDEFTPSRPPVKLGLIKNIRKRTIGLLIRQYRIESNLSVEQLAETIGVLPNQVEAYELGGEQVPLDLLEKIAETTRHSLNDFLDRKSPIGTWAERLRVMQQLELLPDDLKDFVARPLNRPYLDLARRLSEMPTKKLREIAEGLLEITL